MASLGLNIHVDKENATPYLGKGDGLRFGPRNKGNRVQATPGKSLFNVKDTVPPAAVRRSRGGEFLKPSTDKLQPQAKLSVRPDNQANTPLVSESNPKKLSQQSNKHFQKTEVDPASITTSKSSKPKKKVPKKPASEENDGYDSDTILPHADRLSSHMQKLLSWRPPCLFGNAHYSDDDDSLSEGEIALADQIIVERPLHSIEMPDIDMASIMAELPDLEEP